MKLSEEALAFIKGRNELAQENNTEGVAILEERVKVDAAHKADCPCRKTGSKGGEACTDESFKNGMKALEERVVAQKARVAQIAEYDEYIDSAMEIQEKADVAELILGKGAGEAVTANAMQQQAGAGYQALYPAKKEGETLWNKIGNDFHAFLGTAGLLKQEDIKSRGIQSAEILPSGERFNCAASFYATFGTSKREVYSASKSLGMDLGMGDVVENAVKTYREATAKSMFTQVPGHTGGDGSLYAPTAVFAGNTGGLCEYIIDDNIEVLPYPPVSFLDCIPIRRIPKSYVLYVRQTLRINNASGMAEGLQVGTANPATPGVAIDFRPIKPESEFGFTQAKAHTITFADTLAVSEEFLEDCPAIADTVESQLMENVRQEFYDQIINGDGSLGENPELIGLLAQVGLSTRVHRGAASFMGNAMGAGAIDDNVRDTVERAVFDAEAYGYTVDCVLMSYEDCIEMTFLKDEDGHRLYDDAQLASVRGAKIRCDVRMPAGTALAGAFRQVVQILLRRAIRLDIGWVDKQFKQDMLTLRATMRGGLLVKVPHALIRITAL